MFKAIHDRMNRDDKGFTLIELMVVVLIIAILIAIAIPTFLGARRRAQDKQAQSNLRNALTSEKTYYVDNQSYIDDGAANDYAELTAIEASLAWGTEQGAQRGVAVDDLEGTGQAVVLRSWSSSGTLWCLMDISGDLAAAFHNHDSAGTYYAHTDNATAGDSCPAAIDGTSF